jgi:hypothetical protein
MDNECIARRETTAPPLSRMLLRREAITQPNTIRTQPMPKFHVGDVVEVKSADEILKTLDANGELDNLPFMPEMLQFCGKRLAVHKVAHKLCDTMGASGLRWMNNAVHLVGARCDGQGHGGCQTGCSIYWKEAWLKPVPSDDSGSRREATALPAGDVDYSVLDRAARRAPGPDGEERYSCQATELLRAAPIHIRFWNLRQYIIDLRSGNVGLLDLLRTFLFGVFNAFQTRSRRVLPQCLMIKEGLAWGFVKSGPAGKTPTAKLELQPGEFVRIRSKEEIVGTLDDKRLNRGMGFEEEMAVSCGRTARVLRRVDKCIDERTGRMLSMKNPCIVLDGVVCEGVYHANCPREFLPFWREIWLERVEDPPNPAAVKP